MSDFHFKSVTCNFWNYNYNLTLPHGEKSGLQFVNKLSWILGTDFSPCRMLLLTLKRQKDAGNRCAHVCPGAVRENKCFSLFLFIRDEGGGGGGELELFQIEEHCSTPAPRGQDDTTNLFFQWFTEDTVGNLQIFSVLPDEHSEKVVMLQVWETSKRHIAAPFKQV